MTAARLLSRPAHAPAWIVEARALLGLAGPLILTQLAQMAIMTTDLVLLGRFSKTALASAAIGNTIYYFAWMFGNGPASAVAPMVAHALGERPGHKPPLRAALRMGLWAIALVCLPMMAVLWSARPLLVLMGQDPHLAAGAGAFVGMLSFGLPFSLGFMVLKNFAAAMGRPHAALWVTAGTIAFNGLVGWTLIFGHFGAPRLGLVGSGMATAGSSIFSFLMMLTIIQATPRLRDVRAFRRFARPALAKLAEVFRLGMPMGVTSLFEMMLFNVMTLVMGSFGALALAAHQIALNVASITFMVPLGLGMAATVRVGLATGRDDTAGARRAGVVAMTAAAGFSLVCGATMALFGGPIAALYFGGRGQSDLDVIALTVTFLKVGAAFQLFDALQVVGAFCLRGLKDARMPMVIAGVSYWGIGAPLCLALAFLLRLSGLGVWLGLAAALAAAALGMLARFRHLTAPAVA